MATPIGANDAVLELLHDRLDNGNALDGPVFAALKDCLDRLDAASRQLIQWLYVDGNSYRRTLVGNLIELNMDIQSSGS